MPSPPSAWSGIRHKLCPRCREGAIYPSSITWGIRGMNELCPRCGLRFDRGDAGYFLGSMYISFPLGVVLIAIAATAIGLATGWSLERSVVAGVVLFVPLAPFVTRLSRVLWIWLDQTLDPA